MPKYFTNRDTPADLAHEHVEPCNLVGLRHALTNAVDYVKNDVHCCAHYFPIKISSTVKVQHCVHSHITYVYYIYVYRPEVRFNLWDKFKVLDE